MQSNLNYMKILNEDVDSIIAENLPWSDLKDKKILITGANGFIASYIVNVLMKLNDRYNLNILVIALVRNYEKAQKRFYHLLNRKDLTYLIQDVSEPIDVEADIIIHAASPANAKEQATNNINVINANIIGMNNVLKLALKNNSLVFLISSGMVYGEINNNHPVVEEKSINSSFNVYESRNLYAISKSISEILCKNYSDCYNLKTKVARLFSVYGPGDDVYSGRCYNDFALDIINKREIILTGSGKQIRNICYVSDAVSAIFTILLKGDFDVYNVGSNNILSIGTLADEFSSFLDNNEKNKVTIKDQDLISKISIVQDVYVPNIDKLLDLGWKSKVDIKNCIKRTIKSIK